MVKKQGQEARSTLYPTPNPTDNPTPEPTPSPTPKPADDPGSGADPKSYSQSDHKFHRRAHAGAYPQSFGCASHLQAHAGAHAVVANSYSHLQPLRHPISSKSIAHSQESDAFFLFFGTDCESH